MSAQLSEVRDSLPIPKVFDAKGLPVSAYIEPVLTIDPATFYGSITGQYTNDVREKLGGFLTVRSIAVLFQKATEGRPYSIALRLREIGYSGELHAVGAVNKEIMYHLVRVGFSHIHLSERLDSIPREIYSPFSFAYQAVDSKEALGLTGDV